MIYPSTERKKDKETIIGKKGTIYVKECEIIRTVNCLDYVFGGCEINLNIAIDFTASNGLPSNPNSLHNMNFNRNEYLQALRAVGNILQYYDSDKEIPCYGFGAKIGKIQGYGRASHCFALNGDIFAPECNGMDGVE